MAKDRKIDLVILGLLSHEDLTGYDIKKHIDGAINFFWKGELWQHLSRTECDGGSRPEKCSNSYAKGGIR